MRGRVIGWALALLLACGSTSAPVDAATLRQGAQGPQEKTLLASAARTASADGSDQTNTVGRGLVVVIDCTAATASPSVVFTVQGKDSLSGKYYTLLASAAITGISTTVLRIYPGLTAAGNLVASDVAPRVYRVITTAADADSLTCSVGGIEIL